MSNFAFLQQPQWSFLHEAATKAEGLMHSDPRATCFYTRRALELAVAWLYKHDQDLRLPYKDNLAALLHEPTFKTLVGQTLVVKAKLLKDLGNMAVHGTRKIEAKDALTATRELFHFCYWIARSYGQQHRPAPDLIFSLALVPEVTAVPPQTAAQLQQLEMQLRERDAKLSTLLSDRALLDEELQRLRNEITAAKLANAAEPDTHNYSEAETRDYFIDLLLKEAGWDLLKDKNFEVEVNGMPNAQGKGFVDYVLWGDDGKPLALIEAKRTRRSPTVGQQQAKLYADCLEKQYGQRPVIFYSNGYEHWIWDDAMYPPRRVQGFYKKDELALMIHRRHSRKKLAAGVINSDIVERYYQTRAIRRIGQSFEVDHQRKALVVMATGAGKTRTVIALADLLMRCNWAKRVLFLADRVALVNQAVGAFKKYLPDASPVNLVTEKNTDGRVYVSTYPTMMGLIDDTNNDQRRFGVGHFDLIVIDEAHRSVYQKYAAIFDYFDSLLVGLTATPKTEIDRNTYGLFDLESGVPTDAYGLEEAVADGHLVPPKAVSVPLKFQREGIKYDDLSEDEKEEWDAIEWEESGEAPDAVDSAALNTWLFNKDTVDKVLAHLMAHGQKVAGSDRLGKTIIFAKNNDHADFIADRYNENNRADKGLFARVVTYKTEYVQSLIDDFSKRDTAPHIAISVDMLDTGIDVPEVLNLVFFKIVRSKTKFWQMVGRGTRLCPDLFAPGVDKKFFYIFDYCQNLEFFNQDVDQSEGSTAIALSTKLFRARLDMIAALNTKMKGSVQQHQVAQTVPVYGGRLDEAQLRNDLTSSLQQYVAAMNVDNFIVRTQRRSVEKFSQESVWGKLTAEDYLALAREVADLPTELRDTDEEAKRFDLLVLRTQLVILQAKPGFSTLRDSIRAIAVALEGQEAIPAIKAEIVLIQAVAGEEWWHDVTVPMLETMRRRLRALVKLIEKSKRRIVYTDFEDQIGEESLIDLPQVSVGMDWARFKEKAQQFLRAHENHLALQRLRRNQSLTPSDLTELEHMLEEAGASPENIHRAKEQADGLGLFIRSLVGLDRETVAEAFSAFIRGGTANPDQIEFIDLIVQELTQNGVMEADRLYESPFTDISPTGPDGVFPTAQVDMLFQVLSEIRRRAAA